MISQTEFARRIKKKHPKYAHLSDLSLVDKIVSKFPQYEKEIDFTISSRDVPPEKPEPPKISKTAAFFAGGAGAIGQAVLKPFVGEEKVEQLKKFRKRAAKERPIISAAGGGGCRPTFDCGRWCPG